MCTDLPMPSMPLQPGLRHYNAAIDKMTIKTGSIHIQSTQSLRKVVNTKSVSLHKPMIDKEEATDVDDNARPVMNFSSDLYMPDLLSPHVAPKTPRGAELFNIEVIIHAVALALYYLWDVALDSSLLFNSMKNFRLVNRTCAWVGKRFLFRTVTQRWNKPVMQGADCKGLECYQNFGIHVRYLRLIGLELGRHQVDSPDRRRNVLPRAWSADLLSAFETQLPECLHNFSRLTKVLLASHVNSSLAYIQLLARAELPMLKNLELQPFPSPLPNLSISRKTYDRTALARFWANLTSFSMARALQSVVYTDHSGVALYDLAKLIECLVASADSLQNLVVTEGPAPYWLGLRHHSSPYTVLSNFSWLRSIALGQLGIASVFLLEFLKANVNLGEISMSDLQLIDGNWHPIFTHLKTMPHVRRVRVKKLSYQFHPYFQGGNPWYFGTDQGDRFGPLETLQVKDRAAWALFYLETVLQTKLKFELTAECGNLMGCQGSSVRCAGIETRKGVFVRCRERTHTSWRNDQQYYVCGGPLQATTGIPWRNDQQYYVCGGPLQATTGIPWLCGHHSQQRHHLLVWPMWTGGMQACDDRAQDDEEQTEGCRSQSKSVAVRVRKKVCKYDEMSSRDKKALLLDQPDLFRRVFAYRYE